MLWYFATWTLVGAAAFAALALAIAQRIPHSRPGWRRALTSLVIVCALAATLIQLAVRHSDQQALQQALAQVDASHFQAAAPVLRQAAARDPADAETLLALAACESALGNPLAALDAWRRIPPNTSAARRAARDRIDIAKGLGRWSAIRGITIAQLPAEGLDLQASVSELVNLLRAQGRIDAARALLRDAMPRLPSPVDSLKTLWSLDADPFPAGGVARMIQAADAADPDVQLASAHLAFAQGNDEQARAQLGGLATRDPDDPGPRLLALALAEATRDNQAIVSAIESLPPAALDTARWRTIAAHAAGRIGPSQEAAAWQAVLRAEPTHAEALDRLATLAMLHGPSNEIDPTALRRAKAARDDAKRIYEGLLQQPWTPALALELARSAEALGRYFDARAWWTIAARADRDRAEPINALRSLDAKVAALDNDAAAARRDALETARRVALVDAPANTLATAPPLASPRFGVDFQGLDFRFDNGATASKQLPETMSGGVALFDFDNDGWLDVYAVQGGPFPPPPDATCADRLFRNKADGTFEDISEAAGIAKLRGGYGHGVAVGDVNNDGFADVLVTRFGGCALYLNQHGQRFIDATDAWGLAQVGGWPTSAAFADLDGDGDLDLYICQYVAWNTDSPLVCRDGQGRITYCPPAALPALPDRLYRNDGSSFTDISEQAGITAADVEGRGLGVLAADLDDDGRIDLFVANDTTANFFFHNLGDLRFEERALSAGVAANAEGGYLAGMGVACADFDRDGRLDLAVTNFYGECTTFYKNLTPGLFADRTAAIGLAALTRDRLGFGIAFADVNNDGLLDILQANGHVDDYSPAYPYAMPAQVLVNTPRGRLAALGADSAGPLNAPLVGRALAVGDLDNDGRLDFVVVDLRGRLAAFRNTTPRPGAFLTLSIRDPRLNCDAVGALVTVEAAGQRWIAPVLGGGSYQSASDPRLHFGLGSATTVDRLHVRWPSGEATVYHGISSNAAYLIVAGDAQPLRLRADSPPDVNPRRNDP